MKIASYCSVKPFIMPSESFVHRSIPDSEPWKLEIARRVGVNDIHLSNVNHQSVSTATSVIATFRDSPNITFDCLGTEASLALATEVSD